MRRYPTGLRGGHSGGGATRHKGWGEGRWDVRRASYIRGAMHASATQTHRAAYTAKSNFNIAEGDNQYGDKFHPG
jgi:hypothetical protein